MLYERAKRLKDQGLPAEEVSRVLLAEGASPQDVQVILGSLGLGPQPHPEPTARQLATAKRLLESKPVRFAVFIVGALVVAAGLWGAWVLFTLGRGIVEAFQQGR